MVHHRPPSRRQLKTTPTMKIIASFWLGAIGATTRAHELSEESDFGRLRNSATVISSAFQSFQAGTSMKTGPPTLPPADSMSANRPPTVSPATQKSWSCRGSDEMDCYDENFEWIGCASVSGGGCDCPANWVKCYASDNFPGYCYPVCCGECMMYCSTTDKIGTDFWKCCRDPSEQCKGMSMPPMDLDFDIADVVATAIA